MPRSGKGDVKPRHNPLYTDIQEGFASQSTKRRARLVPKIQDVGSEDDEDHLDYRTSARVMGLAESQQRELELDAVEDEILSHDSQYESVFQAIRVVGSFDEDEEIQEADDTEDDFVDSLGVDAAELSVLDTLHPTNHAERKTIADVIFAKMESDNALPQVTTTQREVGRDPAASLEPKIVELFTK
ncbi:hypothetical protein DXG03_004146 [Asterophora parasitica]|uniref:Bystin n=1 Tax=Asterophora parasitica TaxID=117018 RepID=A0A9P7G6Z7_9AGAR|nr:hypothetical protein DXG03_004146 [Asterophora parasitica]